MKNHGRIFLIDDEELIISMLARSLKKEGYETKIQTNADDVIDKIASWHPDLILLDIHLEEDRTGLDILADIKKEKLDTEVVMLTADDTAESAIRAMKLGAADYLTKPFNIDEVKIVIAAILEKTKLREELNYLRKTGTTSLVHTMVGKSSAMQVIIEKSRKIAEAKAQTVLITGESGTGKEVLAHSIHNYSLRGGETFLPINCASIPTELFESELFGFEKGAFTGAVDSYQGRFVQANKGTLFLDEIGELPLTIQAKLLRILDENLIYPLKSKKTVKIDVRLISATNKQLNDEVNLNQFRRDLYYRLKESTFMIAPLRERVEDILPLTRHYIRIYNQIYDKNVTQLSRSAEKYFLNYSWKGNIRELKNTIKSIIPFKKNSTIDLDDLSYSIVDRKEPREERFITLEEHEKMYILKVLKATNFNISLTAEILGINRPRLYRKIKYYQLEKALRL